MTLSGPHRVVYRFTNYGGVDGLDFVLPCSSSVNPFRIAKASAA